MYIILMNNVIKQKLQQQLNEENRINALNVKYSAAKGCSIIYNSPKKKNNNSVTYYQSPGEPIQKVISEQSYISPTKVRTTFPVLFPQNKCNFIKNQLPISYSSPIIQFNKSSQSESTPLPEVDPPIVTNYIQPNQQQQQLQKVKIYLIKTYQKFKLDLEYLLKTEILQKQYRQLSNFFLKTNNNFNLRFLQNQICFVDTYLQFIELNNTFEEENNENIQLSVNIKCLLIKEKMDDQIIDYLKFFLQCYTFDSQFLMSNQIREQNILKYKKQDKQSIFFPICIQQHWYGAYYHHVENKIYSFDSFNLGLPLEILEQVTCIVQELRQTIGSQDMIKLPKQVNSYDCGYAVFLVAYLLADNQLVQYSTKNILNIRYYLLSFIIQNSQFIENFSCSDSFEVV
ncbi:hypothetical protein SS50377_23537 [Spironucleus salmonicida]|uniref:Ubiquitin-like protease family profile domain-containing protein n=1 Tax=Spironucleus salmonicida TaxID=348837 RepID=A0A9P8RY69_9EUKA|nr:hypothetical protein SS50377_23537 [Spironucleus salmonicida]